jgi:HD-GYP domain-containing protein (c-di-GMP phosphodiesterase class II)
VTGKVASRAALDQAGNFLRQLSSARQVFALYPAGHPKRVDAIKEALDSVRRLRAEVRDEPVVFVTRHALYLGPVLLARDSLARYGLVEAFERVGIEAIEPQSTVNATDLDKLVRVLLGELEVNVDFEGLAINRVKPAVDVGEEDTGRSVLRRSYALGLEILRHTAASVVAGQPIDLAGPTRLVTDLSEQVMQDPTQALMLATIRSHDEYTYYHMLNVCLVSIAMGYAVGLRTDQIVSLGLGALLHDIGKVNVPVEVLQHVGALTPDQWRLIQRHPVEGAAIIFSTGETLTHLTAAIVLEHHAAYDLSGYPSLSRRSHPSLPARMVAVADCFDAVTTTRPYRRAEERRQALNILLSGAGRGYDPRVVRTFVRLQGLFPIGSLVRMTNGAAGVVIRNHDTLLARPRVRIVLDPQGDPCDPFELDLSETRADGSFRWHIERSMDPEEVGVDMVALVLAGALESIAPSTGREPGLVHEPAPGEVAPPGYVPAEVRAPRLGVTAGLD